MIEHLCQIHSATPPNYAAFDHVFQSDNFPIDLLCRGLSVTTSIAEDFLKEETEYILDKITEHSRNVTLNGEILDCITNEAISLFNEMNICTIILPRALMSTVPIWNNELKALANGDVENFLWLGVPNPVRVIFPPANVIFNDILISGKTCNDLIYASRENKRLEIKFEFMGGRIFLNMDCWYRFEKSDSSCNVVIHLT